MSKQHIQLRITTSNLRREVNVANGAQIVEFNSQGLRSGLNVCALQSGVGDVQSARARVEDGEQAVERVDVEREGEHVGRVNINGNVAWDSCTPDANA